MSAVMTDPLPTWLDPQPAPQPVPSLRYSKRNDVRTHRQMRHIDTDAIDNDTVDPDPIQSLSTVIGEQYPFVFETMLDKVREGANLRQALAEDPRRINIGDFMEWVMRSVERKGRYYEAQEVAAELMAADLIPIADGAGTIEDVSRSTLRVNTRKDLLKVWNRKRYGDTRQVDVSTGDKTLSELTFEELVQKIAALDARRAMLPPPPVEIDVTPVAVQEKAPDAG